MPGSRLLARTPNRLRTVTVLLAASLAGPSTAAGLPDRPVAVPGQVVGLQPTSDGGMVALAITAGPGAGPIAESGSGAPTLHNVRPDGTVVPGTPATGLDIIARNLALTPDGGAIAAYDVFGPRSKALHVGVRNIAPDGAVGLEEIVSTAGREATQANGLTVGPTGAVAFTFWQEQGKRTLQRVAFRPAGASRFLPPRTLGPAAVESDAIFLGPDGGGVVVRLGRESIGPNKGPVELRRLTPDGRLGRTLRLRLPGQRLESAATGAFAGSTFVLAMNVESVRGDILGSSLFTTSLARGASRPTRPQRLTYAPNEFADAAPLAVDSAGRVTLLVTRERRGIQVFAGRPGRLRAAGRIAARSPVLPRLVSRPDGSLAGFWLGAAARSTDMRLQLVQRAVGAAVFGAAGLVPGFPADPDAFGFSHSADTLTDPTLLQGGQLAIAYNPSSSDDTDENATILVTP